MLSPSTIAENYIETGAAKAGLKTWKMLILAVFAGFFIAAAGASAMIASCAVENPSVSRLLNSLIFPAGLVMVVLAGSELFTGDCLIIISVLKKKVRFLSYLRCLAMVYLGNMIGAALFTSLFVFSHTPSLYDSGLAESLVSTAAAKTSLSFSDALMRGIICNILVCIAVWISSGAKSAADKVIGLYPPIAVFVLGGYEHSVANMFYIPAGLMTASYYDIPAEGLNVSSYLLNNLLPVTLGNIIGGAVVVAGGYYLAYLHKNESE